MVGTPLPPEIGIKKRMKAGECKEGSVDKMGAHLIFLETVFLNIDLKQERVGETMVIITSRNKFEGFSGGGGGGGGGWYFCTAASPRRRILSREEGRKVTALQKSWKWYWTAGGLHPQFH